MQVSKQTGSTSARKSIRYDESDTMPCLIGCEADLTAHVLDGQGRHFSVKGLLDTGAVVSAMPVSTWTVMGFDRSDLIPTNIGLAAANQVAIYVLGRTPIISLQLGGRHLWMSFLVVENLDESDQFILGRDVVRNFIVTIDLNDRLIRIKGPQRKYEKNPLNKIMINQAKVPVFLDRKLRLKPNQAVVATFRMRNLKELRSSRQVCLVPNPNSNFGLGNRNSSRISVNKPVLLEIERR